MSVIKVSSEEFYKAIGQLDVTVTPTGNYPYKTVFALRDGEVIGWDQGGYFLNVKEFKSSKEAKNENYRFFFTTEDKTDIYAFHISEYRVRYGAVCRGKFYRDLGLYN